MKKLMILGGSRYALPVIEAAHKLGIYVITCDYLPDNIAHKYSDEYCNISIIDKEKTLEAARKDVYKRQELAEGSGFSLDPIPWTKTGYFYKEEDQPARHPYYSAGLYYLQEPSAMTPAARFPVEPGERVLDLCAAPRCV